MNKINEEVGGYGVPHKKEWEAIPLKIFLRCAACNEQFTGYIAKAKNFWYHKCRKSGCKSYKSAKRIHQQFQDFISQYYLKPELTEPLIAKIDEVWKVINKENVELEKNYKVQLSEVNKKLDKIEEKHYVLEEM